MACSIPPPRSSSCDQHLSSYYSSAFIIIPNSNIIYSIKWVTFMLYLFDSWGSCLNTCTKFYDTKFKVLRPFFIVISITFPNMYGGVYLLLLSGWKLVPIENDVKIESIMLLVIKNCYAKNSDKMKRKSEKCQN